MSVVHNILEGGTWNELLTLVREEEDSLQIAA
jgi:hypothetical protein